jgi:hypothetical protein
VSAARDWTPADDNDRLIDAILAVPANRERFIDAMAHAQATQGVPDDPKEIERRLHLLLK